MFDLESFPGRPSHNHYAIIWSWKQLLLIRIMPQNWYVLVDDDILYLYTDIESFDTYTTAVRLDNKREHHILHYRYLLEWIKVPPLVQAYTPNKDNIIDILNEINST